MLIEQLDVITQDLDAVTKDADFPNVIVHAKGKQLKYKPLKGIYKEFLLSRRDAVTGLLAKMGVSVNE